MNEPHDQRKLPARAGIRVRGSGQLRVQGFWKTAFALVILGALAIAAVFLASIFILVAGIALVTLLGGAFAYLGFRRLTGRLVTAEELAARHGVTPRDMERILEEQQVAPSALINGRPLYDSRRLKAVSHAVRAAGGPVIDAEPLSPVRPASLPPAEE